ncbi:Orotidine 5'-phosphate decarboxylase / HUMPS family protein [Brevinema andersonii]|uniref:Orotidine 5'-phosphate decarboxylase / HUMPS family protein n=1 Tax=Brevinema andersonii TaxID=34097 RepID=A0A1I1F5M1_BREAD|nr:orotidine 5'-phosphate decarboxylase / HUMPS family protein [Brevinema andersonii]SFB94759.1 Orotidine 5'-phosphate decarboxylase / HUMPS family protein [Brevinema andersonii]
MNNQERLIVALDRYSTETAIQLLDELEDSIIFYKVGLELLLNTRGNIL